MTGAQTVAALTNGSLALVAVVLLQHDPEAVLLLVGVLGVLVLLYRAYSQLDTNYSRLQILQTFTGSVANTVDTEEVLAAVLEQARILLRAHRADIVLLGHGDEPALTASSRLGAPGVQLHTESVPGEDAWWRPALEGTSLICPVDDDVPAGQRRREGMAVPLRSSNAVFGILVVIGRMDDVTTFDGEDLRLFETLGNHAAVSLKNGQLVDRLRHEVTEREYQATHDVLTGLPNRRVFATRVDEALRDEQALTAVMIIDLDGFKEINDTLGHHTGDEVLRIVGDRLASTVGVRGTVARLGGDEFAICLPGLHSLEAARECAQELDDCLDEPVTVDGLSLEIGGSVGVAVGPEQGGTCAVLMQRADVAMYQAKSRGAGVELYEPSEDTNSARRLALVGDLRRALEGGELEVHFQPQVSLSSGRPVAAEALARWKHPELGPVSPEEFIPLAERAGLIRALTLLVLDRAVGECTSWQSDEGQVGVAVNLSVRNLVDVGLPGQVAEILRVHGLPARLLTLEITESHIMSDPARCMVVLTALDRLGVTLSIDDFGTGYSSLAYLKRLPVSEVKIDKGFVIGMGRDADDGAIVRGTINLAHDLGLSVVAEGVEDDASWHALARFGCDTAQGWLVGRPLPAAEFGRWLRTRQLEPPAVVEPTGPTPTGPGPAATVPAQPRGRAALPIP
jgi:diguanylate cyclase (GGDEF)-like protein